jgi:hypothetical protein
MQDPSLLIKFACDGLYKEQPNLLDMRAHERTITGYMAQYLREYFPGFQVDADDNLQGPEWAYIHSMSDGTLNQTAADAMTARDAFETAELADAKAVLAAGGESQGMFLFGLAMHPVMDMTSPAHTDALGNPIPWCGYLGCGGIEGLAQVLQHSPGEYMGEERIQDLNANPKIQKSENTMIRSYFQSITGQKLNCPCNK